MQSQFPITMTKDSRLDPEHEQFDEMESRLEETAVSRPLLLLAYLSARDLEITAGYIMSIRCVKSRATVIHLERALFSPPTEAV